ncbi:hypothetical protein GEMRC1_001257 [Eukaryota sp. GEM-RC1]
MGAPIDLLLSGADLRSLKLHASEDTKIRAIYTLVFLNKTQADVAQSTVTGYEKFSLSVAFLRTGLCFHPLPLPPVNFLTKLKFPLYLTSSVINLSSSYVKYQNSSLRASRKKLV